ncbi:MAG: hypothetical protein Q4F72_12055 [Desulfovibrionaceae bacterium]|nr:hypothetical protein [Desulfovibrionaceae bacterium]
MAQGDSALSPVPVPLPRTQWGTRGADEPPPGLRAALAGLFADSSRVPLPERRKSPTLFMRLSRKSACHLLKKSFHVSENIFLLSNNFTLFHSIIFRFCNKFFHKKLFSVVKHKSKQKWELALQNAKFLRKAMN